MPPTLAAESAEHALDEAEIAFDEPCPYSSTHGVPITVLAGREDRFFPFEFQQRVARERLGVDAQPVPGGHLAALSEPDAVAQALIRYVAASADATAP